MRRILIVEDEPILRETYELILSTEPYQIDTAPDGHEALQMCQNHSYDLILLDLMMPNANGVQFLERFKHYGTSVTSKVIVLSNLSSGDELARALSLGAYKNILKANLSPKQLLSVVRYELAT